MNDGLPFPLPVDRLSEFCRRWRIAELSLFGSVVRDDFRADSDIDVLVSFEQDAPWSAFDLVTMRDELVSIFGRDVDLAEEKCLRNPSAAPRSFATSGCCMSPEKSDLAYPWDMLDAAKEARAFIDGVSFEQYATDRMRQRAVERAIEIIGEASRNVSDEFQAAHPEIAWRPIKSRRHVLAHEYGDIDPAKIWRVAAIHVLTLIQQLDAILAERSPDARG